MFVDESIFFSTTSLHQGFHGFIDPERPPRVHSGHAASSGSGAVRRLCASTKGVGSLEGSQAAGVSGASGT